MRSWSSHPLAGFAIVLGAASLFGMLGPLSRFAYDAGMEPLSFVAWRALIGLLALGAFVAWQASSGRQRLVRPGDLTRRERLLLGVAGLTGFSLNLAMFIAFDRITVALALLGFYTYPAMVAVVAVALGRERIDRAKGVALALATAGMVLVVAAQLDPAGGIAFDALGFGLALGAALSQAIYVSIAKDGYRRVPTAQATTVVLATTLVLCTLLAVATGAGPSLVGPLTEPGLLPIVLFTGVFAAAIPSLAFLTGIRRIGGMRAGILMLFEPVVGVALAAWLLSEPLQPVQAVGGAAILAAAIVLQRSSRSETADRRVPAPAADDTLALRVPGGP